MPEEKKCLSCGKTILGRADKKFCDDFCRNNYNNLIKGEVNNTVRNITNILKKNRRILDETLPEKEEFIKTGLEKLTKKGFNFDYHTHTYTNKKGDIYQFCFEYGYLLLDGNAVLIVRRK